jgi:hypothetical protein
VSGPARVLAPGAGWPRPTVRPECRHRPRPSHPAWGAASRPRLPALAREPPTPGDRAGGYPALTGPGGVLPPRAAATRPEASQGRSCGSLSGSPASASTLAALSSAPIQHRYRLVVRLASAARMTGAYRTRSTRQPLAGPGHKRRVRAARSRSARRDGPARRLLRRLPDPVGPPRSALARLGPAPFASPGRPRLSARPRLGVLRLAASLSSMRASFWSFSQRKSWRASPWGTCGVQLDDGGEFVRSHGRLNPGVRCGRTQTFLTSATSGNNALRDRVGPDVSRSGRHGREPDRSRK